MESQEAVLPTPIGPIRKEARLGVSSGRHRFGRVYAIGLQECGMLHVILDNYCTHKRCDAWLLQHPKVHFHFTPTSASWLNQVEIWFGILSRKALRGLSAKSTAELRQAIEAFIKAYAQHAKPFKWRKREVKGTQLRNTIVNLCN